MRTKILLTTAVLVLALSACGPFPPSPEPTRRPTITPSPEATVEATTELTAEATDAP
jgi:hypothetical protein